jgi:predicted transcriptional regulator of viral defense system
VGEINVHSRRRSHPPLSRVVAELAGRQWGVVSRVQLVESGLSAATIDHWVRRSRLHVVHRGVYAVGHGALRVEGGRLAAVLACGGGAVLSHLSGAAHWGLLRTEQTRMDVTTPRTRRKISGILLHRSRSLDARDATTHEAIPVTTIARTLLDLAATVPESRLERALAQAERLQLYDHRAITDVMGTTNGHRGIGTLARAIRETPHLTRSELEVAFRKLVRRAGLPQPLGDFILDAPDHPRLEVDFYFPTHDLVVETDGWETHGTKAAFHSDRRKNAALTLPATASCASPTRTSSTSPTPSSRGSRRGARETTAGGRALPPPPWPTRACTTRASDRA